MKVEYLAQISFSPEELRNIVIKAMREEISLMSPHLDSTKDRIKLVDHIEDNFGEMDWVNGDFVVSADGIAKTERFNPHKS